MKSEATSIGYKDTDIQSIDLMFRKFDSSLPAVEKAVQNSDPSEAQSAFNTVINLYRGYVIDSAGFGEWSRVWRNDGLRLMRDAASISMTETDVLRERA